MMGWLNEYEGFIMVVLTAIYAFTTIWILRANNRTVKEARKMREEENRPYVIIYFELKSNGIINLVIKNTGKTLASNIKFNFDTPLNYPKDFPLKNSNLLMEGIPSMPPEFELKAMVEMMNQLNRDSEGKYPRYNVTVTYSSPNYRKNYKETFVLDPNIQSMLLRERELEMHDLVKSIDKLVRKMNN